MDHFLGALLAQNNDQNHEQAIYYLSRIMIEAVHHYNPIEKECLALVFDVQNLWHYLMGQCIQVISRVNPLWLLMTSPSSLNSGLVKWVILLSQYEMQFMPQNAIKAQAVVDFLADHPVPETSKLIQRLLRRTSVEIILWQSIENKSWGKSHCKCGGSTYLPT